MQPTTRCFFIVCSTCLSRWPAQRATLAGIWRMRKKLMSGHGWRTYMRHSRPSCKRQAHRWTRVLRRPTSMRIVLSFFTRETHCGCATTALAGAPMLKMKNVTQSPQRLRGLWLLWRRLLSLRLLLLMSTMAWKLLRRLS
ncbi:hypothetical protein OH77DRAFT_316017 [Trametes cingulata]|nr:hypothetical protein OH77DRAFT_316017 [Trametes cingulata]